MDSSFMTSILGGCDILFKMLLLFIGIDYITGVLGAIYKGKLSSNVSAKGIIKKSGYILLVVVAGALDVLISSDGYIRHGITLMFIANEGISILENWARMGIKIPEFIKERFGDLKNNEDINVTKTVEGKKDSKKDIN